MSLFIYLIYLFIIFAGFCFIYIKNPVHSVFLLVIIFLCVACLLLTLQVEFLAFLLLLVYIGAVSILFIFVVMMLNIRLVELSFKLTKYLNLIFILSFIFFLIIYIYAFIYFYLVTNSYSSVIYLNWAYSIFFEHSLSSIGHLFYILFCPLVLFSGILLFVAMYGVLVLVLYVLKFSWFVIKKQNITTQILRRLDLFIFNLFINF